MSETNYAGIDYSCGSGSNQNSETGIRFGVIHSNRISPEAFEDIIQDGTDCDFEDYKTQVHETIKSAIESACGDYFRDESITRIVESAIDTADEDLGENYESSGDCTRYLYESNGYKIQVASDGDMFILQSPYVTWAQFCSPCAPGACYLSSPLDRKEPENKCYCLGPDWFDSDCPMPYEPTLLSDMETSKEKSTE